LEEQGDKSSGIIGIEEKNMKMLYATSISLPNNKHANKIQIFSMAKALTEKLKSDFFIGVRGINSPMDGIQAVVFSSRGSFSLALEYLIYMRRKNIEYLYCREPRLLIFIFFYNRFFFRLKFKTIYEAHHLSNNTLLEQLIESLIAPRLEYIVFTTSHLKEAYLKIYNCRRARSVVLPDCPDLNEFGITMSRKEARRRLRLAMDKKIILYTGHLYKWKGVDALIESSKSLGEEIIIYIVGGAGDDIANYREKYKEYSKVIFIGHKPHKEIPVWLKAADVLVLPNSGKEDISVFYTSPLKMFEYMASGRPIVASDLPSIREVLSEKNAFLVKPNDSAALVNGINTVLSDIKLVNMITAQSLADVQLYSWDKRSKRLITLLNS